MMKGFFVGVIALLFKPSFIFGQETPASNIPQYGVDISFPMHHPTASTNYPWLPHNVDPANNPTPPEYVGMPIQLLGNRQAFHEDFIKSCVDHYNSKGDKLGEDCLKNEADRIAMNLRQPKSVYNYTELGYDKVRAPDELMALLREFWDVNEHKQVAESRDKADVYINDWAVPTTFLSVEDESLQGGGDDLKAKLWDAASETISEWTGQTLSECSLYGIRVYHGGSILSPHVDRLPLVASAIINVDQDVDEPWPLEVIGHDGVAVNITMEPGDMVLYESHSVIHGRPFPLKGRYMANVFIHFEPIGSVDGQVEFNGVIPPYLIPESEQEEVWHMENPEGHVLEGGRVLVTGTTEAHFLAGSDKLEELEEHLDRMPEHINLQDANGWTVLHEAIRVGNLPMIEMLLERGADPELVVGDEEAEEGGSALWLAKEYHDEESEVVQLLEQYSAEEL